MLPLLIARLYNQLPFSLCFNHHIIRDISAIFITYAIQNSPVVQLGMARRALSFYRSAQTLYHVHSPYLYELLDFVLDKDRHYYDFDQIEGYRHELLADESIINFRELGAGSRHIKSDSRKITDIAKTSLSSPRQCQLLYRLVNYLKPNLTIEMGTSLGISTAYLASAYPFGRLIALEGDPHMVASANRILSSLKIHNAAVIEGDFKQTLPDVLNEINKIDMAFIDGNHTFDTTISYYEHMLPYINNDSVLIFDDVNWTADMQRAWQKIRHSDQVTASIDFYYFGIIFFRKEFVSKIHHDLVPVAYKPWTMLLGI